MNKLKKNCLKSICLWKCRKLFTMYTAVANIAWRALNRVFFSIYLLASPTGGADGRSVPAIRVNWPLIFHSTFYSCAVNLNTWNGFFKYCFWVKFCDIAGHLGCLCANCAIRLSLESRLIMAQILRYAIVTGTGVLIQLYGKSWMCSLFADQLSNLV